ncbi:hypothetical protein XENOCAPTIV_021107 [Xenoophorus captivus]|uniref:Uncharacterized protein n=1 Tax=Xenoophorus captivus TaxID=1517983 RepID=A0ABV0QJF5_9TELE
MVELFDFVSAKQLLITDSSPLVLMAIHRMQIITQCIQYTKSYSMAEIQKLKKRIWGGGAVLKNTGWSEIHSHLEHRRMEHYRRKRGKKISRQQQCDQNHPSCFKG